MTETPDSHDLDKLTRWHEGLVSNPGKPGARFPVCALFLASGEDGRAHDIFRVYRTAFEELGAEFHDLVIFGQHGTSTTCGALIPGLGLAGSKVPYLALITGGETPACHVTSLPAGVLADGESEADGDGVPWAAALEVIRRAAEEGNAPALGSVRGLERVRLPSGTLAGLVGQVKDRVEALQGGG